MDDKNKDVRIFTSEEEVSQYYEDDKENNQVVIFEGIVYDVKEFAPGHPGGPEYLEDNLGKNIDEAYEEAEHTKMARKIFNDLPVRGKMVSVSASVAEPKPQSQEVKPGDPVIDEDYTTDSNVTRSDSFDYSRGISWQVWTHNWTYEEYMAFINEPKHFVNPVRDLKMFDNEYLEPFSKCPWYALPIFWAFPIYKHVPHLGDNWCVELAIIFAGVHTFLLCEYLLHRFLFHGEFYWMQYVPKNRYFYYLHFNLHGIHHAFPMDRYRLVLPPVLGYFYFAVLFKWPFYYLVPEKILPAWEIGFLVGYLMYDLTHYFIHHSNPPEGSYFKMMKTYHLQHHYKKGSEGFGISNKIWDKVFDTEIKMQTKDKRE